MTGFAVGAGKQAGKTIAKISDFATLLHRYFATTYRKMPSEKNYPLATSLLRYNLPKNGLRKKIPPRYIATSLQPPEKWPPEKKYPLATSLLRYNLPKTGL